MTVAPYRTTMKNFHPRYRPLSQLLSTLYPGPPESKLLYAPCSVFFFFFFFLTKGMFPIFCFSFHSITYRKSNVRCSMYYCMYGHQIQQSMDQPGKVANPARGQRTWKMNIPLSPCVPENLVSRNGFSRPVPR